MQNLQIVDTLNDAFNSHNWDRLVGLLAESVIFTHPAFSKPQVGVAAFYEGGAVRQYFELAILIVPDYHLEKIRSFGQNDWVCWMGISVGTYTGSATSSKNPERPPISNLYRVPGCIVYKLENGRITEIHNYFDRLALLTQLDVDLIPNNQEGLGFYI
jgi:hypothetical protein